MDILKIEIPGSGEVEADMREARRRRKCAKIGAQAVEIARSLYAICRRAAALLKEREGRVDAGNNMGPGALMRRGARFRSAKLLGFTK